MKILKRFVGFTVLVGLLLAVVANPGGTQATNSPSLSNSGAYHAAEATYEGMGSSDPMEGQRSIVRDDELVVFHSRAGASDHDKAINKVSYPAHNLKTMRIVPSVERSVLNDSYLAVATGRMHTDKNDQIFNVFVDNESFEGKLVITAAMLNPATGYHNSIRFEDPKAPLSNVRLDCDTGDFDGDGRDELAVVYEGYENHLNILIVKGTGEYVFEFVSHYEEQRFTLAGNKQFAVTNGDFDSDSTDEIAVIYEYDATYQPAPSGASGPEQDEWEKIGIHAYDVSPDFKVIGWVENRPQSGKGADMAINWRIPSSRTPIPEPYVGTPQIDIASGNFDGQPGDEIIAVAPYYPPSPNDPSRRERPTSWDSTTSAIELGQKIATYRVDSDLNVNRIGSRVEREVDDRVAISMRIAVGDLDRDMTDEATVAWTSASFPDRSCAYVYVYNFDPSLKILPKVKTQTTNYIYGFTLFMDVAIGNFGGVSNFNKPDDFNLDIAVFAGYYNTITKEYEFSGDFFSVDSDLLKAVETEGLGYLMGEETVKLGGGNRIVIASGDFDGDSVDIGEPIHWVVEGHVQPNLILAEPPKHIDYIKDHKGNITELNVSRHFGRFMSPFTTKFEDENQTEITATTKHSTDWNLGVDVEGELGFGLPAIGKVTVEGALGYAYEEHQEAMNKEYHEITTGKGLSATNDDYLVAENLDVHIWRYPVIGHMAETEDGSTGPLYLQVSVPSVRGPRNIEGRAVEWYQPVHETGNIFSYPWRIDQIEDLGELLTVPETFNIGSDEAEFYVKWKDVSETGEEKSTKNKLTQDASITAQSKTIGYEYKVEVSEHFDKTWFDLTTATTKTSRSRGITIEKPDYSEAYAYQFTPIIYTSGVEEVEQDGSSIRVPTGAIKVAFIVDPLATAAKEWWLNVSGYGDSPDLALNLPHLWYSEDGNDWEFNEGGYNLKMMKGLHLLDSDGELSGYYEVEGKPVTVRARIYDYSFVDAKNVRVKFGAQESTDGRNWGDRFEFGNYTVPLIQRFGNAQGRHNWEYAEANFDTSGKAGKYYRFWVTIDPNNEIEEIEGHDTGEEYTNNEGYFSIPLAVVPADASDSEHADNLFLESHSDKIAFSSERPQEGDTVMISLKVAAEGGHADHVFVYFYDGNPDEGGKLFDIELIPHIVEDGYYYLEVPYHTSGKVGTHDIYVSVHEILGETDITDNTELATLVVYPADGGMSSGAIAGIVAGTLAVLAIATLASRRLVKGRNKNIQPS